MKIGNIELDWLGHSGFLISNGKSIYIDPYNISKSEPKADIILITHGHYDHCSLQDISKIIKKGTTIVVSPDCQSKITKLQDINMQIAEPGDEITIEGIKIHAVPAYNPEKIFHPKSENWNGYLIKFENVIIYHAGDCDFMPEMKNLTGYGKQGNEFIVLLPVGGNFTMNVEEAVEVAKILNPSLAIPMHYGSVAGSSEDGEKFVELCKKEGINAVKLERI
jgi:L-ascorbate metabolism protein UlaG (beta-lactamase superfamily)